MGALKIFLTVLCLQLASTRKFYVTHKHGKPVVSETDPIGPIVAFAEFKDHIDEVGWSFLTVKTNSSFTDVEQADAAGIAEGFATALRIKQSWTNTMAGYCKTPSTFCINLKEYIKTNMEWMQSMIKTHKSDPYWHQVRLILHQIEGIYNGFRIVYPGVMTEMDFWIMNSSGDLEDLESALAGMDFNNMEPRVRKHSHMLGTGSCSAIIKLLPGNKDLLTSHITWNGYQSMIRIIKNYIFPFQTAGGAGDTMPGNRQVFTSYPGYIASGDDYTLLSSGLLTQETTIGNSNDTLWKFVNPKGQVLEFIRSSVANRLGHCGMSWSRIFKQYNSGTYNNQWMIVDYTLFTPGEPLKNNTLWILEQIPGFVVAEDQTDVLRAQQYWPSYNTPSYPFIFNMSGDQVNVDKYGSMFAYETTPRALIFRRDQDKVLDMDGLYKLMRYNNYKEDPLSACDCTPPYSAENAIAARSDLNPANGSYPLPFLGHRLHGATDYKGTNYELFQKMQFRAAAGPPYDQVPPFIWSQSDWADQPHHGMKDQQTFEEILVQF